MTVDRPARERWEIWHGVVGENPWPGRCLAVGTGCDDLGMQLRWQPALFCHILPVVADCHHRLSTHQVLQGYRGCLSIVR
jgi:hypothetical protein